MIWNPLKLLPKKNLGIDIGTACIRVIEIAQFGSKLKLENYGALKATAFYEKPFRSVEQSTLLLSSRDIAKALAAVLQESKIKTKKAVFAIPDFSSFFTWFDLPPMTKQEVPSAVKYEARQHIPLPPSEVILDWQIIEGKLSDKEKNKLKILLVAVPKEVLNQYEEIARLVRLELLAVEPEVFALSRGLARDVRNEKKVMVLVDIGAQSTTVSIIDKGVLKRSHSFDVSGNEMTKVTANALAIGYERAERLKEKYGLNPISQFLEPDLPYGQDLRKILCPLIDLILLEVGKITQDFYQAETKEIEKIILAGGSALLPGLKNYFAQELGKETEIADPFTDIFCPPILEETLKAMGPTYAIAVGAALR